MKPGNRPARRGANSRRTTVLADESGMLRNLFFCEEIFRFPSSVTAESPGRFDRPGQPKALAKEAG